MTGPESENQMRYGIPHICYFKRLFLPLILGILSHGFLTAQNTDLPELNPEELVEALDSPIPTGEKIEIYQKLVSYYFFRNAEECISFAHEAYLYSREHKLISDQAFFANQEAACLGIAGELINSVLIYQKAIDLSEAIGDTIEAKAHIGIGIAYMQLQELEEALEHFQKADSLGREMNLPLQSVTAEGLIASVYEKQKKYQLAYEVKKANYQQVITLGNDQLAAYINKDLASILVGLDQGDSAYHYIQQALYYCEQKNDFPFIAGEVYEVYSRVERLRNNYSSSVKWGKKSVEIATKNNSKRLLRTAEESLARTYLEMADYDEALKHTHKMLSSASGSEFPEIQLVAYQLLSEIYHRKGDQSNAFHYLSLAYEQKEKINRAELENSRFLRDQLEEIRVQNLENEQLQEQISRDEETLRKSNSFGIAMGLFALIVLTIFLFFSRTPFPNKSIISLAKSFSHHEKIQRILFVRRILTFSLLLMIPIAIHQIFWGNFIQLSIQGVMLVFMGIMYWCIFRRNLEMIFFVVLVFLYPVSIASAVASKGLFSIAIIPVAIFLFISYLSEKPWQQIVNIILLLVAYWGGYFLRGLDIDFQVGNKEGLDIMVGLICLLIISAIIYIIKQNEIEAQAELARRNQFLRQISDLNPHFIFAKDNDRKLTFANEAMSKTYGLGYEQLIGLRDEDIHKDLPEDNHFLENDKEVLEKGRDIYIPRERIISADGKEKWLETTKKPIFDEKGKVIGLVGISSDITDRIKTEKHLLEHQATLNAVIQSMPDAMLVLGMNNEPIFMNQKIAEGFIRIFGRPLPAKPRWDAIFEPESLSRYQSVMMEAKKGKTVSISDSFNQSGQEVFLDLTFGPINDVDASSVGVVIIARDVTDLRQKEADLKESRENYRALYENMSEGVVVYDFIEEKIVACNPVSNNLFGFTEGEDISVYSRFDLIPRSSPQAGEDLHAISNQHREMILNKQTVKVIAVFRRLDDTPFYAETYIIPSYHTEGQGIVVIKDITEARQAERELRTRKRTYQALIEHSFNGIDLLEIIRFDPETLSIEGSLIERNNSMKTLLGVVHEDPYLTMDSVLQVSPETQLDGRKSADKYRWILSELIEKGSVSTDWRLFNAQGKSLDIEMVCHLITVGKKAILIRILRDVTKQKKQQKIITEQVTELNRKNKELEKYIESNLNLENFAYLASHDLRAPIRTIVSFAQLLEKQVGKRLEEDEKEYLQFLVSASRNMSNLIEDLLAYSRINTTKIHIFPLDMAALLEEIRLELRSVIEEKNARIIFENIPRSINADRVKLRQLFQNLIGNALKFTRSEVFPEVRVCCHKTNDKWEFSVSDNGIGIAGEYHDRIFLLFKRLHHGDLYEGTGIGLALCKKIVEQHSGEIWLTSEPGVGTTFYFTIPDKM